MATRAVPVVKTARVPRKLDALLPLRLWHLASLDAPTVATVWALAFAWAAEVRLPAWVVESIALVVWPVYIADRLLDAGRGLRMGRVQGLRERHVFHWRRRHVLAPLGVASALAAGCLILAFMPDASRGRGTVLAAVAALYFARVHAPRALARKVTGKVTRWLPSLATKEMLVGVLFSAGCALPAWNRSPSRPWAIFVPAVFFAALAWLNCAAITQWEDSYGSGARSFVSRALFSAIGLIFAGAALAIVLAPRNPRIAALLAVGAASALLLALLDRIRGRITPLCLRAAADLVLLTPLALLFR